MVGFLGYIAAGAAEGMGKGIVEEARSLKEQRMKELERDFHRSERLSGQDFQAGENEKSRKFQLENRQGDMIDLGGGKYGVRQGARVEPLVDAQGNPVEVNVPSGYRQLTPDEVKAAGLDPSKGYQVATSGADKGKISQIGGGGTTVNNIVGGQEQTKGRTKVDEKYAEDFVDWNARGAYADINKQVGQLEEALVNLETKDNISGPGVGSLPDFMSAAINPDAITTREMVEEVVQRNLRLVLGAQFTEKEGERLIARAYNPRMNEAENARRVRRLITQIKTAAEAKQAASEYFAEHGTLTGWGGKLPSITDFDPNMPAVGDVLDGFRFKGGNPADPSSWEKVN